MSRATTATLCSLSKSTNTSRTTTRSLGELVTPLEQRTDRSERVIHTPGATNRSFGEGRLHPWSNEPIVRRGSSTPWSNEPIVRRGQSTPLEQRPDRSKRGVNTPGATTRSFEEGRQDPWRPLEQRRDRSQRVANTKPSARAHVSRMRLLACTPDEVVPRSAGVRRVPKDREITMLRDTFQWSIV